jgi:type II secretory pathway component PulK
MQKMTHRTNLGRTIGTALVAILLTTAAIADTETTVVATAQTSAESASNEISRRQAEKATKVATEKAIAAVLADTKLDLDIRLIGPTSTRVAGER